MLALNGTCRLAVSGPRLSREFLEKKGLHLGRMQRIVETRLTVKPRKRKGRGWHEGERVQSGAVACRKMTLRGFLVEQWNGRGCQGRGHEVAQREVTWKVVM